MLTFATFEPVPVRSWDSILAILSSHNRSLDVGPVREHISVAISNSHRRKPPIPPPGKRSSALFFRISVQHRKKTQINNGHFGQKGFLEGVCD